jgi:hypothetical protein
MYAVGTINRSTRPINPNGEGHVVLRVEVLFHVFTEIVISLSMGFPGEEF